MASIKAGTVCCELHAKASEPRLINGIIPDADVIIRGEKRIFDLARLESWPQRVVELAHHGGEFWHGVERATGVNKTRRPAACSQKGSEVTIECFSFSFIFLLLSKPAQTQSLSTNDETRH
jgi:hypothetical protein